MLHAVSQLPQHVLGQVQGVLGNEIDAHALGTDQTHHLFDLFHQNLGGIVEKQVGLVEEEHQLGPFRITHLRQLLEELGEHP